jgi:hypothetical protein
MRGDDDKCLDRLLQEEVEGLGRLLGRGAVING